MEDPNNPDNQGVPPNDEPLRASDRDIPSVAQDRDYSKIGIIALVGICALAIILVALDGMNKSEPTLLTEPEQISFKTPSSSSGPYIQTSPPEPAPEVLTPVQQPQIAAIDPMELQMQQEALRLAREQKKRAAERLRSPQLVYDDSRGVAVSGAAPSSSGGGSLTGGDRNLAFADQYGRQDVAVATASQMENLDTLIAQGTMIDGILETAVQSDLPGMVRAIVSEDVFSFDGSHLVIPKGAKLIGRYNSGLVRGQTRVFVIWNRLLRPDGVSVNIGSFGTDDLGRSGLAGYLDTHFLERFGSSVLLSLIDASIQIGVESVDNDDTATVALDSGNDFSRAAEIALENSIGIPPTIHIDQGTRIKVFVAKDLDFSQVAGNIPKR